MWFQLKCQGQIQGQIRKKRIKRLIALLSFVILPKFTKVGISIIYQGRLQCIGFYSFECKLNSVLFPWRFSRWRLETPCQNNSKNKF